MGHDMADGAGPDEVAATRALIIERAAALFAGDEYEDVTLLGVAGAAGVSHQVVLNLFGGKEGVALAVARLVAGQPGRLGQEATPGDLREPVSALVGGYERSGEAIFRWAVSAGRPERRGDEVTRLVEAWRALHREWLESQFDAELPGSPRARRRALLALHAATDVYTWRSLRRDLGLSRTDTERIMTDLVAGVVGGGARRGNLS
jgi:AcrR family transcriptional regulator